MADSCGFLFIGTGVSDGVSAVAFGLIEGFVGSFDEPFDCRGVLWITGDAGTDADIDTLSAMQDDHFTSGCSNRFSDTNSSFDTNAGQYERHLFTAVASHERIIGGANVLDFCFKQAGKLAKNFVTCLMSVMIVNVFEVVEIQQAE